MSGKKRWATDPPIIRKEKQRQAWDLYINGTTSVSKIAEIIGMSIPTVRQYLRRGMEAAQREMIEDARQHIILETKRLDRLMELFMAQAEEGNVKAGELILKIAARRATLLGLNKPVKIAPTDPTGELPYEQGKQALEFKIAILADRVAAATQVVEGQVILPGAQQKALDVVPYDPEVDGDAGSETVN